MRIIRLPLLVVAWKTWESSGWVCSGGKVGAFQSGSAGAKTTTVIQRGKFTRKIPTKGRKRNWRSFLTQVNDKNNLRSKPEQVSF